MSNGPRVYVTFPGTARPALQFGKDLFGGDSQLHTFADFHRTDGPVDTVAHGELAGTVSLGGADAAVDESVDDEQSPTRSDATVDSSRTNRNTVLETTFSLAKNAEARFTVSISMP